MAGATILSLAAFYTLLKYQETLSNFTFDYPPVQVSGTKPEKHIRGDLLTDLGKKLFASMSVGDAVLACGGIKVVRANHVLLTQQSEKDVEMRMLRHYVVALSLITAALFTLATAVHRSGLLSTNARSRIEKGN
jgi:hypothetical protein